MTEFEPIETVPCCSAWKSIRDKLIWCSFEQFPEMLRMPTIANGWRVNFCPSCGKQTSDSIWKTK